MPVTDHPRNDPPDRDHRRRAVAGPARLREPQRAALLAVIGLATLLATSALAQPRVDATSVSTQSATLLSFLESNSSNTSGMACFRQGRTPDRSYNCLLQVVRTAGMEGTLGGAGPITVFAPTDSAFAALASLVSDKTFSSLMRDPVRLKTMLEATILPRRLTGPDLSRRASGATGKATVTTLGGTDLAIAFGRFEPRTDTTIAVGQARSKKWQAYVSDRTIVLNNGSLVPISMVVVPQNVLAN